jgi:cytochrome c oxidase subunit 2
MIARPRLRRVLTFALTAALALAIIACLDTGKYPNTTFEPKTDLGRSIDYLWDRLLLLGTIVFVLVEIALLFIVWKYRHREGQPEPRQIHGNTKLEILWTLIPAAVLVFIAVPTVTTIFDTQAKAPANALKIEVIGHQWWWEFRLPQYEVITANELYIPTGRVISFELKTTDVLHSFWIPQLGAKRDVISNRSNFISFTADTTLPPGVWNGFCTEYCGASHANMHFRVFTVSPAEFQSWAAWQRAPAAFTTAAAPVGTAAAQTSAAVQTALTRVPGAIGVDTAMAIREQSPGPVQRPRSLDTGPAAPIAPPTPGATPPPAGVAVAGYVFPRERIPRYAIPNSPMPRVPFPANLVGDPRRGEQAFLLGACVGCHTVRGNPVALGQLGPNLTHFASRSTIAGGMYPNDPAHLARWVKNAPQMKPGALMPTIGKGQYDPVRKVTASAGSLTDQQIADVVAYLQALK